MDIRQKKFSHSARFEFGEDELRYTQKDGSGSRSFSLPYAAISRDRQTLEVRNDWLRNVGLLWIALGAGLTAMAWFGDQVLRISLWVWIGLACYAAYRFRSTGFTILPTEKGNLLVIDDSDGPKVLGEIERRRAEHMRREYDFFPEGDTPEQLAGRFRWLHREGALSDAELEQRLARIPPPQAEAAAQVLPSPGQRLN